MKTIKFYSCRSYGVARVYLADSAQAATVSILTGKKTVDLNDLLALQTLGCTIEQVPDPSSLLAPFNLSAMASSMADVRSRAGGSL